LHAKTFELTVKSVGGCLATQEVKVERKSVPSFVMAVIVNPCEPGDKDFSAFALGGYGEITYALDNGPFQRSGLFSDLKSGSYKLRARDSSGCETSMEVTVPDKNQAVALHGVAIEHAKCGGEFGALTLSATGSGQLQYSLDGTNYVSSPSFSSVIPGARTVFVKDGAGCTDSTEINVIKRPAPKILEVIESDASCNGNDGALIIHATGSGPLFFSVDAVNYVTDTVFTGLSPLVQTVYLKDTAGCSAARSVIIGRDCLDNVYIPTAFSPDRDGINEVMEIKFSVSSVKITSFRLFNRWGNVIASVTNKVVQSGVALWDGSYKGDKAQPGAYPYELNIEFENGKKGSIRNTIMLMR
jgi:gliding motility-associated-like protein